MKDTIKAIFLEVRNTKMKKTILDNWKTIVPSYLYKLGVKMWGKKYMEKWYIKDMDVLIENEKERAL